MSSKCVLTTPSGERLLDPAQVWLTERDKDGATELYPLTDAEPGEDEEKRPSADELGRRLWMGDDR